MARTVNTRQHLENKLHLWLVKFMYSCKYIYIFILYRYFIFMIRIHIFTYLWWIHMFLWEVKEKYSIREALLLPHCRTTVSKHCWKKGKMLIHAELLLVAIFSTMPNWWGFVKEPLNRCVAFQYILQVFLLPHPHF